MPRLPRLMLAAILAVLAAAAPGQSLREDVAHLASPELRGRMTGTPDEARAAEHIAAQLAAAGAQPHPAIGEWRAPFPFVVDQRDFGSRLEIAAGDAAPQLWTAPAAFQPCPFADPGKADAPVVALALCAADGGTTPTVAALLAREDVRGRTVLLLGAATSPGKNANAPEFPLGPEHDTPSDWADAAHAAGASALLIHAPTLFGRGERHPPGLLDRRAAPSPIPAAFVDGEVVEALLAQIDASQRIAMDEHGVPSAARQRVDISGASARVDLRTIRTIGLGHNVVAIMPANAAESQRLPGVLAFGAHYDHLGDGRFMGRAAFRGAGEIYFGADDNASGTAVVLEIARRLAAMERRQDAVFLLWSGEELGLLGSRAFVADPPFDLGTIEAYFNFDMVGRLRGNSLQAQVHPPEERAWRERLLEAHRADPFVLRVGEQGMLGTDSTALNAAGVPTVTLFTGLHDEYHTPKDTAESLNYDGMERIVGLVMRMVEGRWGR